MATFQSKDSGNKTSYESGMNRDSQEGKPRFDLLSLPMLIRWAELMARGAEKYGEDNWKKAETSEELEHFRAAAWRHFIQYMEGLEDEDHAAAVFFNISGMEHVKSKIVTNKESKT